MSNDLGQSLPAVRVQAGEDQVNAEVTEDRCGKTEDRQPGDTPTNPATGKAGVQEGRVDKPDDQAPGLFRVPAPISTPGIVGPGSAGDDANRQHRKANHDGLVVQIIQNLGAREHTQDAADRRFFGRLLFFVDLDQIHDRNAARQRKGRVADKAGDDMVRQPVALQSGHEGLNGRIKAPLRPDHTAERKGDDKGTDGALLVLEIEDQVNQQNRPGKEDH